ncbi:MAG: hypothetical protein E7633_07130 [Ruminococcaceae bacterium]|nr:hypothetical protein [Oscillospiraceae bacterium]
MIKMIKKPSLSEYKYINKRKRVILISSFSVTVRENLLKLRRSFERTVRQKRSQPKFLLHIFTFILCLCLICTGTMKIYRKAEPIAISALENTVAGWLEETVINAVKCELEEKKYGWDDFCTKIVTQDGSIAALTANTANISMMCADVVARINRNIEQKKHISIPVPIGSIVAPKYLSGKGFRIKVRAVPYISVSAEISSEMREAGINQTLHRISMTVTSDVQVICMSESVAFRRVSSVILAESLIVGKIPIVS